MQKIAQNRDHSRVEVLVIRWEFDEGRSLDTTQEIEALRSMLEKDYHFSCDLRDLMCDTRDWDLETQSREYRRNPDDYRDSDTARRRARKSSAAGDTIRPTMKGTTSELQHSTRDKHYPRQSRPCGASATSHGDDGLAQEGRANSNTEISRGTSTYGAPEWERGRKTGEPVPQSIDIWSLGCVFSKAATWVALGCDGTLGCADQPWEQPAVFQDAKAYRDDGQGDPNHAWQQPTRLNPDDDDNDDHFGFKRAAICSIGVQTDYPDSSNDHTCCAEQKEGDVLFSKQPKAWRGASVPAATIATWKAAIERTFHDVLETFLTALQKFVKTVQKLLNKLGEDLKK
ncbi:hypothetical protein H2200_011914 [Cladophialophora chaetospira]|uniref:Protein kinase domain-containing protein n=1 Tax=Cladophialophora chaetospira TaxID=386627 RepID=A0AA39CCY7_9EURO|nr:hypothetical protein H2200_011914 [Cladophialophora chaetospira]